MRDRQTCVGCHKRSPETETDYTLISAQFGWRLARQKMPDGSVVIEWRCPTCWREHKRAHTAPNEPPSRPKVPGAHESRPSSDPAARGLSSRPSLSGSSSKPDLRTPERPSEPSYRHNPSTPSDPALRRQPTPPPPIPRPKPPRPSSR